MPGQLQGEVEILEFQPDAADRAPAVEGTEGDDSGEEEGIEVSGNKITQWPSFKDHSLQ